MTRIALKESGMATKQIAASSKMNKDVYGNWSKYSKNWISGPTDSIRRQHVPGYTGHVRGMVNKGAYSQSYARVTANLFARKHPIGTDTDSRNRFGSTQRNEYKLSNNRRFGKSIHIKF